MSNVIELQAEERNMELNPRQVRAEGKIPATIYGKGQESVSVQVDKKEFVQLYKKNKDAVYNIKAGKKSYKTIVQKLQIEASTKTEMNIEFKTI
jgi:large subunit ribosomal protein L25